MTQEQASPTPTDAGSTGNGEKELKPEKEDLALEVLENASPAYDESKILSGRKLFFAFIAMLLSVLLIALGVSLWMSVLQTKFRLIPTYRPNHYCPCSVRKHIEQHLFIV
jgi:hypothetical protein